MYRWMKQDEWYWIYKGNEQLFTPMGALVRASSNLLADRLVTHLAQYGESPAHPESIVAFHYSLIDFFLNVSRAENERSIAIGLDEENDWTFDCPTSSPDTMMKWWAVFGQPMSTEKRAEALKWLSSLTLMQLCAVCIIGRYTGSVNIPYRLATTINPKDVKRYAKDIVTFYPYLRAKTLHQAFENFLFYFTLEDEDRTEHLQGAENSCEQTHPSVDSHLAIIAGLYRTCGPESPEYAVGLSKLAGLYLAQSQYGKAERTYERALAIMEKALDPEYLDLALCFEGLAQLYRITDRELDAKRCIKQAKTIRAKTI